MKVLYFHQHFTTPSIGGGTRSYEFSKKLIARGHAVTMVCGRAKDFNLKESESKDIFKGNIDGINIIQIAVPYSNDFGIFKRAKVFLKFAFLGIKIALNEDYDLLFATSTPLTAGIPGIFMKWFGKKKKFVFEVRDLWPELPKALGMKNPFLIGGMSILEKLSYRKADGCIGLSPGICKGIGKRSQKNKPIIMIPNGCDLDLFQSQDGNNGGLSLEGISPSDTVAIFTGAHGIANGLDAVLDAAEVLIQRKRKDIALVFIGDGKLKKALIERAKNKHLENCHFFDPVSKLKLKSIMVNADVGLMILKNVPAFYYGTSPNKFFDYISSSLPVLNNYPGWLAEMIKENECGIAFAPDNPEAFADALVRLADDPGLRKKMGKNGRLLAEREFSRDKLANEFVDFLEMIEKP